MKNNIPSLWTSLSPFTLVAALLLLYSYALQAPFFSTASAINNS